MNSDSRRLFVGGSSRIWMGDGDDEGWSFVVSGRLCVGSETGIDTEGSNSVSRTDSVTTVSTTGYGMVFCWVEVCVWVWVGDGSGLVWWEGLGGCWLTKSIFLGTDLVAFCGVFEIL